MWNMVVQSSSVRVVPVIVVSGSVGSGFFAMPR
jgi:hypothetical protein